MAPENKRIVGDVKDEKNPRRVAHEARWRARNLGSKNPSGLGASRWGTQEDLQWSLETTRDRVFEKIKEVAGVKALNPQQMGSEEDKARSKVYEDMYTNGCGINDAAASVIKVEYYIDAQLWKDHVQRITKEEFPWKWPEIFQQDEGYADFVKSKSTVNEPNLAIRPKPPVVEPAKKEPVKATMSKPESVKAEPAKAEPAKTEPAKVQSVKMRSAGKAVPTTWEPETMTLIFDGIFGAKARFEGMGGFDLPMERSVIHLVNPDAIKEAAQLLPGSIELKPVNLGWGRGKLCLRFGSFVEPGRDDFQMRLYHIAWTWCLLVQWKENLLRQAEEEILPCMYDGFHAVIEEWTKEAGGKLAHLSLPYDFWAREGQDDMAGLKDEASKQRLFDAVSKELASSRGQDDEARACGIVDWAGSDPEKLGGGPRSRTYLAIEAMCRYCESVAGEEKLGMIAQQMKPDEKHAAPSLLKKWAAQASQSK